MAITTQEVEVLHSKIVAYVQNHPDLTYPVICQKLNITRPMLTHILKKAGFRRNKNNQSLLTRLNTAELFMEEYVTCEREDDLRQVVNSNL